MGLAASAAVGAFGVAVEVPEQRLKDLHGRRGGHDAHADERHAVERDGVLARGAACHPLRGINNVEGVSSRGHAPLTTVPLSTLPCFGERVCDSCVTLL